MTDITDPNGELEARRMEAHIAKRYRSEKIFRGIGIAAIVFAVFCVVFLFVHLTGRGFAALWQNHVAVDVYLDAAVLDPKGTRAVEDLRTANYQGLVKKSLRAAFPKVKKRRDKRRLYKLVSAGSGGILRDKVLGDPSMIGQTKKIWFPVSDDVNSYLKGTLAATENSRRGFNKAQVQWLEKLQVEHRIESHFNIRFFTSGDSREPEIAGIWGAVVGSLYTLLVCLLLSFPIGVMAAIYLEEFAPRNRWTDWIEININNLAAVPSIVFGLLGLAVFLNVLALPRSAPLVGGMVLALMTLPTIIIATRVSLKAVPPSIREAALGIGASPMQTVFHHVLPLALPGILTGTIIGMARSLGETAPLLMIGMVAFIVDIPQSALDPATALPVQIFLWVDSPERGFVDKTAAGILVLLTFLILMNISAVVLRKKYEIKW